MALIVMVCDGALDLFTEWADGLVHNALLVVVLHGLSDITLIVDAALFVIWITSACGPRQPPLRPLTPSARFEGRLVSLW